MTLRFNFPCAMTVLFFSLNKSAHAFELSLSVGQYEPSDGVVLGMFHNDAPAYLLRLGVPFEEGLSWSSTLIIYEFESKVSFLQNDVRLTGFETGFRKTFRGSGHKLGVDPFFGASGGAMSLRVNPEDELTETSYEEKTSNSFSSFWEVGAQITNVGIQDLDLEIKLTDLAISHKLFGNMSMSGRIVSMGVQYRFSSI